jgi:hypothetical protein
MVEGKIDQNLEKLQVILNNAIRSVLSISRKEKISVDDLMKMSGQSRVSQLALRATMLSSWKVFADCGTTKSLIEGRVDRNASTRTRAAECGIFPPQKVTGTLISNCTVTWNNIPQAIKDATTVDEARKKIRKFVTLGV